MVLCVTELIRMLVYQLSMLRTGVEAEALHPRRLGTDTHRKVVCPTISDIHTQPTGIQLIALVQQPWPSHSGGLNYASTVKSC